MLIYQVYPRSFKDSNADGIGDLKGVTEKLPYIASLGVDALWISPFVKSPQKDFGYDVEDYCAVDPRFGTLTDFKRLLDKAHKLKLKVLMDQVLCHCSDAHPWFKESRKSRDNAKADWFIWHDGKADGLPPNNWLSYFGGPAWSWDTKREQYYFHQFLSSQPTFNLRHKGVRAALMAASQFWLDLGVDGFRLDAIHTGFADPQLRDNPARPKNMPPAPDVPRNIPQARQIRRFSEAHPDTLPFLEELRKLTDKYGAVLLGEVNGEDPYARAALYTQGKRLHSAYNFGLLKDKPNAKTFAETVVHGEKNKKNGSYCYALSNHDVPRVASRWGGIKGAKAALLFGLSLPGAYCMYQGEELGLTEADVPFEKMQDPFGITFYPEFKGRDGCRTPMPWQAKEKHGGFSGAKETWLPFAKEHARFAVDTQEKDKNSVLHFARKVIAWRKTSKALQEGAFVPVKTSGGVIAFIRRAEGEELLLAFNTGEGAAKLAVPKGFSAHPLFSQKQAINAGKINMGSMGYVVLHKKD